MFGNQNSHSSQVPPTIARMIVPVMAHPVMPMPIQNLNQVSMTIGTLPKPATFEVQNNSDVTSKFYGSMNLMAGRVNPFYPQPNQHTGPVVGAFSQNFENSNFSISQDTGNNPFYNSSGNVRQEITQNCSAMATFKKERDCPTSCEYSFASSAKEPLDFKSPKPFCKNWQDEARLDDQESQSHLSKFPLLSPKKAPQTQAFQVTTPRTACSPSSIEAPSPSYFRTKAQKPSPSKITDKVSSEKCLKIAPKRGSKKENKLCTCGLTDEEAYKVNSICGRKNMEYVMQLLKYDFEIAERRTPKTNKIAYVFVCKHNGDCNQICERSWNFLDHCRMHKGIKPFKCDICKSSFTQKGNWEKHKETHKKKNL